MAECLWDRLNPFVFVRDLVKWLCRLAFHGRLSVFGPFDNYAIFQRHEISHRLFADDMQLYCNGGRPTDHTMTDSQQQDYIDGISN